MVLKNFTPGALVNAYHEASAYASLKSLQGVIIPCCYGAYDVEGREGVGLLLEKVDGYTLRIHLESNPGLDRCHTMFLLCWHSLERMHAAGRSHGDISADNILFVTDHDVVFIDLEILSKFAHCTMVDQKYIS
jgi:tRNA A-37 threonylcarbamoyl transferase component Bud32